MPKKKKSHRKSTEKTQPNKKIKTHISASPSYLDPILTKIWKTHGRLCMKPPKTQPPPDLYAECITVCSDQVINGYREVSLVVYVCRAALSTSQKALTFSFTFLDLRQHF
jgi:hypothetical protein